MEKTLSTEKFSNLNFNLKKIVFSFLTIYDQRTIYWLNKKLRHLLTHPPLRFNKNNLKKCGTYQFNEELLDILMNTENYIYCFTKEGIILLSFNKDFKKFEFIKNISLKTEQYFLPSIQLENGDIIYRCGRTDLTLCDKDLNIVKILTEEYHIWSICELSELSFAIGLEDGSINIYSYNSGSQPSKNSQKEVKNYKFHSHLVSCLLYIPNHNYLVSGSYDKTINVLSLLKNQEKSIKKLTGHFNYISSLININDELFASGSFMRIKIWSVTKDFECIMTLKNNLTMCYVYLNLFKNDFMVSRSNREEFKVWDLKTYDCLYTYNEDSNILKLIVNKNIIITRTEENKISAWESSN